MLRRYSADLLVLVGLLLLAGGLGLVYGPLTPIVFGLGLIAAVRFGAGKERRFLDGHPALFPDAARDWEMLRESAQGLPALGAPLDHVVNGEPPPQGRRAAGDPPELDLAALRATARARAAAEAAHLADTARAAALDLLGDAEGAAAIAERRLRASDG